MSSKQSSQSRNLSLKILWSLSNQIYERIALKGSIKYLLLLKEMDHKGDGKCSSRIGRFLLSVDWVESFGSPRQTLSLSVTSDH